MADKINHIGRIVSIVLVIGTGIGITLGIIEVFGKHHNILYTVMTLTWLIAGIMALIYVKDIYQAIAKPKIDEEIHERNVRKIENELLRAKKLLDNGILTQKEFDTKVKNAKKDIL